MSGVSIDPRLSATRAAPRKALEFKWSDPRFRNIVWQVLIIGTVAAIVWYLVSNTRANLAARHIATGFSFLSRDAHIPIGETLIDYDNVSSTYGRALVIGILNTLKVAVVGVILATIWGTLLGVARLSRNWLVSRLAGVYVEVIRDIPVLLQLLFWYGLLQSLPPVRQALHIGPLYLSARGINFPMLDWTHEYWWVLGAFLVGALGTLMWGRTADRKQEETGVRPAVWPVALGLMLLLPLAVWASLGAPWTPDVPVLGTFNLAGGGNLSPEYGALTLGLVIYTAAYIAEIVRSGILAVPTGQWEAAGALGHAAGSRAAPGRAAAGDAGDHPAHDQPVPEPHQELVAGRRHRLPGRHLHRADDAEPDGAVDRGDRAADAGVPYDQPVDQPVHELVQHPDPAGGALTCPRPPPNCPKPRASRCPPSRASPPRPSWPGLRR